MSIRAPTHAEMGRHRRAVDKLRGELFRVRSPGQLQIDPLSEQISPPYIGKADEPATFGGLRYRAQAHRPGMWYEVSVIHECHDRFSVTVTFHDGPKSYHALVQNKPFSQVADCVAELLNESRRRDSNVLYWQPRIRTSARHD